MSPSLRQIVKQRGIDAFKFDDFIFVGKQLSQDPARLVLVGGQAIETWGHHFEVLPPTGNHEPLTEDTDFLGGKKDAQWLCNLLGKDSTDLVIAKDFDPSVNSAIAYLERPDGRILMIDFLRCIIGVNEKEIALTAVPISVAGINLHVLHPLLCLKSRLANLERLPSKRNANGKMQAEWAIAIVGAWLRQMAALKADQREMIKACTSVSEIAEFQSGPYCYHEHGLDPLMAVTDDIVAAVGGRFVTEDWRRKLERIEMKRTTKQTRQSPSVPIQKGLVPVPTSGSLSLPIPIRKGLLPAATSGSTAAQNGISGPST